MGADGETHIRVGKLNMVDLAGSERQSKTGAEVCLKRAKIKVYIVKLIIKCLCCRALG